MKIPLGAELLDHQRVERGNVWGKAGRREGRRALGGMASKRGGVVGVNYLGRRVASLRKVIRWLVVVLRSPSWAFGAVLPFLLLEAPPRRGRQSPPLGLVSMVQPTVGCPF